MRFWTCLPFFSLQFPISLGLKLKDLQEDWKIENVVFHRSDKNKSQGKDLSIRTILHMISTFVLVFLMMTLKSKCKDFEYLLVRLHEKIKKYIDAPRSGFNTKKVGRSLDSQTTLHMMLYRMRHYPKNTQMAWIYTVSTRFVSETLHHVLPILYCNLDFISWPTKWVPHSFESVSGAVDCLAHYWFKVHPKQGIYATLLYSYVGDWYRGDKHAHLMTAEVVCDLQRNIVFVALSMRHNNDVVNLDFFQVWSL